MGIEEERCSLGVSEEEEERAGLGGSEKKWEEVSGAEEEIGCLRDVCRREEIGSI